MRSVCAKPTEVSDTKPELVLGRCSGEITLSQFGPGGYLEAMSLLCIDPMLYVDELCYNDTVNGCCMSQI
jgi:hypothetical protein